MNKSRGSWNSLVLIVANDFEIKRSEVRQPGSADGSRDVSADLLARFLAFDRQSN
jgi:hypothetical protein